jgi:hypothetical protein
MVEVDKLNTKDLAKVQECKVWGYGEGDILRIESLLILANSLITPSTLSHAIHRN